MLPLMPWNVRSAAFASWQVEHDDTNDATCVCIATVITGAVSGVPLNLKPPVPKLVAEWHALQAIVPADELSGGMCSAAGVTIVAAASFQVMPTVWQVWHARFTEVCPAADSAGVVPV